ncbi:MAG: porin family protein [Dysgonamonadaceae bacterium]|nr:porin family protein [Dysgonamonadaceae bacterium]
MKHRFFILTLISMFAGATTVAQEYHYEIGGMAGLSMYMGDANKKDISQGWHPALGAVFRKNMNFRWALKADLLMGSVSGDTRNMNNAYPEGQTAAFRRNLYELGGQLEFNFMPYSDKFVYLQTSRISPYLFAGLGLTCASGDDFFAGMNFPVGVGVKYKIMNRVNLGLEYSFRKLFADDFDAPSKNGLRLDNPYQIGGNLLKNRDWYSILMFTVTWDFGPNDRKCIE